MILTALKTRSEATHSLDQAPSIDAELAEIFLARSPGVGDALQEQMTEKTYRMLALRLATLGQGDARERMAVLFQELWQRQIEIGRADDCEFPLPISQAAIGDALGLTAVHVSRTLGKFEEDGILSATQNLPGGHLHLGGKEAKATLRDRLIFHGDGVFTACLGSSVHMAGADHENYSTNSSAVAGLDRLRMVFTIGPEDDL